MAWISRLFIFFLGAIAGSFLNVCIHRMPREESIVAPPSHCPHCRTPIKPYDNIPIISYVALRGRCRYCGERISPRYLIVELLTAFGFVVLSLLYAASLPMMIIAVIVMCGLIVVFFVDLEHQIIPDEISLGGIAFGLAVSLLYPSIQSALTHRQALLKSLAGLALGGGIFWLIRIVGGKVFKKEAMGLGDVKLMAAIGALLGPALTLFTTFAASFIGSAVGLSLIASGRAELRSRLPFGPFICAGALLSFLCGNWIIGWYLSLLR
jgi:leader peptidase (prepilin peptidase)/N-methyltransferase